jgi:hypothetical protein
MPSRFGHGFRVSHTALEQERAKGIGLKDLAPWFDRPIEFRILAVDCFPEYAVGWFEQAAPPNGDREQPIRAHETPQLPYRSLQVRDKKYPEYAEYSVECSTRKRQALEVCPEKVNVSATLCRSSLGSFTQELFGEIDSDNLSGWTNALGGWNGGRTHATANIENGHAGNERETIDGPLTVTIPE